MKRLDKEGCLSTRSQGHICMRMQEKKNLQIKEIEKHFEKNLVKKKNNPKTM